MALQPYKPVAARTDSRTLPVVCHLIEHGRNTRTGLATPVDGDYWLGLDVLHQLTSNRDASYNLYIRFVGLDDNSYSSIYEGVRVSDELSGYRLSVEKFLGGSAGDGLIQDRAYDKLIPFSTWDRDQDASYYNCARRHNAAWWYTDCNDSNINAFSFDPENTCETRGIQGQMCATWSELPDVQFKETIIGIALTLD